MKKLRNEELKNFQRTGVEGLLGKSFIRYLLNEGLQIAMVECMCQALC